ncbi:MAG TPA: biliverdin-producing heme oxygenase [Burkholderiales bacterium]|nr:biliverdin-producing heme oxygenase [Burkholderiales bacterium]
MNLLSLLRERTRAPHARLDAALDFAVSGLTPDRYAAFLRGVLAVVAPLENALARWPVLPDGPPRAERVRSDLARLGIEERDADFLVPTPTELAEAYGCAYVLEGSSLGGLVLARSVEENLGSDFPTSYLRLREPGTGRKWREWLERLDAWSATASKDDADAACGMAAATFDAYTASLKRTGAITERCACTP